MVKERKGETKENYTKEASRIRKNTHLSFLFLRLGREKIVKKKKIGKNMP